MPTGRAQAVSSKGSEVVSFPPTGTEEDDLYPFEGGIRRRAGRRPFRPPSAGLTPPSVRRCRVAALTNDVTAASRAGWYDRHPS